MFRMKYIKNAENGKNYIIILKIKLFIRKNEETENIKIKSEAPRLL